MNKFLCYPWGNRAKKNQKIKNQEECILQGKKAWYSRTFVHSKEIPDTEGLLILSERVRECGKASQDFEDFDAICLVDKGSVTSP